MRYVSSKGRGERRNQTGSVLVLVLIVVSSLTAVAVGLAYRTRIEMRLAPEIIIWRWAVWKG
jgi:type II secretory pathway component PulK